MDGLSSASGVFAAVSIAIELAATIRKIVKFGKAVKDAPTQIRALFQDLEVLDAVITRIEQLNQHVAVDNVSEKALQNCQIKLLKLQNVIDQAQLNIKSKSRFRRNWGAFKFVLNEAEIQSIQASIQEAKSTLQLAQTQSLVELVLSTVHSQKQTAAGINTITFLLLLQSAAQESNSHKMQIDYCRPVHSEQSEQVQEILLTMNSTSFTTEKVLSPNACKDSLVSDQVAPFAKASRPFDLRMRNCQASRQFNMSTPILAVSTQSRASVVKTIRASEVHETLEKDITIIFYPKATGRLLGITRGMLISAKATSGWQYTIQPFRAVEETALIFEFCREGNLDGVRSLFKRNEASPLDRDEKGQTPLLIASQYLQFEVARFLLQEGADPHESCWERGIEPMLAVALNQTVDIEPKLGMIHLLQNHRREDYEDLTIGGIIWHFSLFYRPQKDINISWVQRRAAIWKLISTLLPFFDSDNPYRSDIIYLAVNLCYEQEVLQYVLRTTKGYIDLHSTCSSIVHRALHRRLLERDPTSAKLIVKKTKNLHRCEVKSYKDARTETPTMLAMYDMKTFLAWRNVLHDLGHETIAFVEQELTDGPLKVSGWTKSSLCELFDTEILPDSHHGPTILGFPNCERCGHNGTTDFAKLKVDLLWRRYLRDIRMKHSSKTSKRGCEHPTSPSTSLVGKDTRLTQGERSIIIQGGRTIGKTELPYRIVCSDECLDGVCIAWVYEDEAETEPDLPPYSSVLPKDGLAEEGTVVVTEEESCPTNNMPGAFKDT